MAFIGRVSLKHLSPEYDGEWLAFCISFCALSDVSAHCFVFELGDVEKEPHLHFYFESKKSIDALRRHLIKAFKLPPKAYSLKPADPQKLDSYFVYLAKGGGVPL